MTENVKESNSEVIDGNICDEGIKTTPTAESFLQIAVKDLMDFSRIAGVLLSQLIEVDIGGGSYSEGKEKLRPSSRMMFEDYQTIRDQILNKWRMK